MRVVHVSKVTGIAGSEGYLLNLLPGLLSQGFEPHMLVLVDPGNPVEPFHELMQQAGVRSESVVIKHHADLTLIKRLRAKFRALNPQIVHTHLLHADLYGLPAAAQARVLYRISTRHNDDRFRKIPILKWLNQNAARKAARIVTISDALERFVVDVEGIPVEKVKTIRYGLSANVEGCSVEEARQMLQAASHEQIVLFIGRLVEQKGVDVLLRAFAQVRTQHPRARLKIVGDGGLRNQLETLARQLGIGEVTQFVGWLTDAQRLMPGSDMVVVPSRWEGFGLVTLEAMRHARPLLVSSVSALPEIVVDGETGLLVPPDDVTALATALDDLLAHPEKAAAMGKAGRERLINTFSVEKMVQATAELYQQIVGQV